MESYGMQDQAVQNMEAMADRLTARTAGRSHWGSTGRGMVAGCRPGQEQTGPPKGGRADAHAGRRQHRGGNRLGGGRPSAQTP